MLSDDLNTLAGWLGRRDIASPDREALQDAFGIRQADVFVLFGGSILAGADVFAEAGRNEIARKYIIVGGAGHTTPELRRRANEAYPDFDTGCLPEAEVFDGYIYRKYGLHADYLECRSTNCGNNITLMLDLLAEKKIPCSSMILCQDASMQLRMGAGLKKYRPEMLQIHYAAYRTSVVGDGDHLTFDRQPYGMWNMERYISLLMGEIPRLRDDPNGYGPRGRDFIAHVDVPDDVLRAFHALQEVYAGSVRTADPAFASVKA